METRSHDYRVYIMASRSLQLYVGVTSDLYRRVCEHRAHQPGTFTARYRIDRLVYYEHHQYIRNAIAREKVLKDWNRLKKLELIQSVNPTWIDLSEKWGTLGFYDERNADPSASLRDDKQKAGMDEDQIS